MPQTSIPAPPGAVEDHPISIHRGTPRETDTADPRHVLCSLLADPALVNDLMEKVHRLSPDFPNSVGSQALFASFALWTAGFQVQVTGGERQLIARLTSAGWRLLSARKTEPAAADLFVSLSPEGDVLILGIVAAVNLRRDGQEHTFHAMYPTVATEKEGRRVQFVTDQPDFAVDFWLRFPCGTCAPPSPRQ